MGRGFIHAGSSSWFTEMLKYKTAVVSGVSNTCAYPAVCLMSKLCTSAKQPLVEMFETDFLTEQRITD